MHGVNLLTAQRKSYCYETIGIAGYRKIHVFGNKTRYVNQEAVNPGVCEKLEVTRATPGRLSRTTDWETLV